MRKLWRMLLLPVCLACLGLTPLTAAAENGASPENSAGAPGAESAAEHPGNAKSGATSDTSGADANPQGGPKVLVIYYSYSGNTKIVAERLREKILANKADARVPADLSRWADIMRLMTERDKRKTERIAAVIDWAAKDPFWSGNILSADSLRRHFDRLELAMQREGKTAIGEDAISRAAARLERMGL